MFKKRKAASRSSNIIYMIEIAGAGGIAHYTFNLLNHFRPGNNAILYTGLPYELENKKTTFTRRLVFNRLRTNPLRLLGMYADAAKEHPLAVHFQLSQYPSFILLLSSIFFFLGCKIVVTAHNTLPHECRWWHKKIYAALYGLSSKIIVHSNYSKKDIETHFRVNRDKIVVVDHGNYSFFIDQDPANKEIPREVFTMLFFGFIREYKGLDVLLHALATPQLKGKPYRLHIVGKPVGSFSRYQRIIDSENLTSKVITDLGYVPIGDVKKYFSQASVVVLPYRQIDQSGVLQLAYAFSKPVVVTRVGGLPEVVEDGGTGYIVAPGDVSALAQCLNTMMNDRALTVKLGKRAAELARTRFSWDVVAPRNQFLYSEL